MADLYLDELIGTFLAMRPSWEEWDHVWNEFKRQWAKVSWPLPSEFPSRLAAFRARQAAVQAAGRAVTGQAEEEAAGPPHHEPTFRAYCAHVSAMCASPDPAEARWGRILHRMAVALIENRDDQDRPRPHKVRIYREGASA